MRLDIITLFADACTPYLNSSILGRAQRRGLLDVHLHDPRSWAGGRHRVVDDRPYGGGPGMVLKAPPIAACLDSILDHNSTARLLMTSPQGRVVTQDWVQQLSAEGHVVILCGHYEGIDERIVDIFEPEEFSMGDFVLSGGELAALCLVDAMTRLLPGALGHDESALADSFSSADGLLDHPCYTKPSEFRGREVPAVLRGGNHAAIEAWRSEQRVQRTTERRPDLL